MIRRELRTARKRRRKKALHQTKLKSRSNATKRRKARAAKRKARA